MDILPPDVAAEIAAQEQADAADSSASRVTAMIRAQPAFAITPEWFAQIAACLAGAAKHLPKSHREHAEIALGDFSDAMRCDLP